MKTTIKNGLVITFINEGYHSIKIKQADILVEDGVITDIREELPSEGNVIDAAGKWIFPGFVNVGSSTAASVLARGLIPDYKRHNWQGTLIYSRINPLLDIAAEILDEDEKYDLMLYGLLEGIASGTTTIVDMNRPEFASAAVKAANDIGLRSKIVVMRAAESFPKAVHEGEIECTDPSGGELDPTPKATGRAVEIDGLYSIETTSEELWKKTVAVKMDQPVLMYGGYSNFEKQISWTRYGKSPIAVINDNGCLGPNTVLVQSLMTDFFDRERLKNAQSSVALSPMDAFHDGLGLPIVTLLKQDINTAIGTGYTGFSMLEEMKLAAYGAKLETGTASQFQASDALYAATVAGSRAIGESQIGRIDIGYYADLVIVEPQRFRPSNYPIASLVYYGEKSDIDTVIIGGETVYSSTKDRKDFVGLGLKVQSIAEKVWSEARKNIL